MTPIIMTNEQRRMFYQMLKAVEELTKTLNEINHTLKNPTLTKIKESIRTP